MNSIILTGANRGLGKEIHDSLVSQKSPQTSCYFTSRKPIDNPEEGFEYFLVDFDKADRNGPKIVVDSSSDVVVFINNAGTIDPICMAQDISLPEMERALRVNCTGPLTLAQHLVIQTREIGARLLILNVSSGAARHPVKGWIAYCVSKAAALMALDVLAAENEHVQIEHFDPGVMDTDMQKLIRSQSPDVMPDVCRFQGFKEDQILKKPSQVAEHVISIIQEFTQ